MKHDGCQVETFVVNPESKSKTPAVVIIHEIFGIADWVYDLADQVAAAGYIAVAPDLLSGMGLHGGRTSHVAPDKVMGAVSHLNPDQVRADLNSVADYVNSFRHRTANGLWWASVGGGSQSYGFYAENDERIDAALPDTKTQVKALGKAFDPVVYDGAGHGWPGSAGRSRETVT